MENRNGDWIQGPKRKKLEDSDGLANLWATLHNSRTFVEYGLFKKTILAGTKPAASTN